jgi:bifunctional UDP-N-acetylglucosamine pyrophosphorylase/glucosamine-1-phosphate N-acetyltransferase
MSADLPGLTRLAVVVLAAGKGTRLKGDLPKVLHPLAGRSLIRHVLAAVRPLDPVRTVVVVGHGAPTVRSAFADLEGIECVDQMPQLGTGHAVMQAREALIGRADRVLVVYGDVPLITTATLATLLAAFEAGEAPLAILTNLAAPTAGMGRIVRDAAGRFLRIVEERDATDEQREIAETNSGIGVYRAEWLWDRLPAIAPSRSGEIYLTDLAGLATAEGQPVASHAIADPDETLGVNTRVELAAAEVVWMRRRRDELGRAGVTFRLPETIAIEAGVEIGVGAEIGPDCRLGGPATIGDGCAIGPGSDLRRVEIAPGARILGGRVHGYRVGPAARIGPDACLLAGDPADRAVGPRP